MIPAGKKRKEKKKAANSKTYFNCDRRRVTEKHGPFVQNDVIPVTQEDRWVVVAVSDANCQRHCLLQSSPILGHHHQVVAVLPFPVCLAGHHTHRACVRVNPEAGVKTKYNTC